MTSNHPLVQSLPRMSPSELARRSGVAKTAIFRWYNGVHPRHVLQLRDVAQACGRDLDLFKVRDVDPKKPHRRIRDVSDRIDPLVRDMFAIAKELGIGDTELAEMSGVSYSQIDAWRSGKYTPSLFGFECCLMTLGYELRIVE